MKTFTTLVAACAVLYSVFCPVVAGPLPEIHAEGRQFDSRFAPIARPVFPRSYWDNVTATDTTPAPKAHKRSYPAGPSASAYVFHARHFGPEA
ncbi:hypothetical protein HO173_012290 [Letharia columbiana]|uniref:Uncharacterized protein n=1 Tax=Letharia columbiana TaxID=112416 RepID=A0A8H6CPE6_9LECA|nr:uncharacterized protein HO173_012290 [Letharia columbiana]KAF6226786.1 hypothetical protein HO173_012290 [Letharia columbiana]